MKKIFVFFLSGFLFLSCCIVTQAAVIPKKIDKAAVGVKVLSNAKAVVDISNLAEGFVMVKYTGGKNAKIKVQIQKSGDVAYTYDLNSAGNLETFPLTSGDGNYTIKVMENVSGNKYSQAYSGTFTLKLRDAFLPFLYSNQFVNYTSTSKAVTVAQDITKNDKTTLEKVQHIYSYVVNNLTYDYKLAETVASGYLPNVDAVLAAKKGICFDYSALMCAMLRSQDVPTKLMIGYAGEVYHAWISVYIENVGWVDQLIYFDGKNWSLMDPTFISSSKNSKDAQAFVSNTKNYVVKYVY